MRQRRRNSFSLSRLAPMHCRGLSQTMFRESGLRPCWMTKKSPMRSALHLRNTLPSEVMQMRTGAQSERFLRPRICSLFIAPITSSKSQVIGRLRFVYSPSFLSG